jgi:hypothetical protein
MKKARRSSRNKAAEQRQAFEEGRRLSFTAREVSKRLANPTREDAGKVARRPRKKRPL